MAPMPYAHTTTMPPRPPPLPPPHTHLGTVLLLMLPALPALAAGVHHAAHAGAVAGGKALDLGPHLRGWQRGGGAGEGRRQLRCTPPPLRKLGAPGSRLA